MFKQNVVARAEHIKRKQNLTLNISKIKQIILNMELDINLDINLYKF